MFTSQATSQVDYSDSDDSMQVAQEKVRKVNMHVRHIYCECHYMIAFFVYCTVFVCGGECRLTAGSSGSPHSFSPALLVAVACYVYLSVVA